MALIAEESGKKFERPEQGKYVGTIIDVVDLGFVAPKENSKFAFKTLPDGSQVAADPVRRVRIIWILNKNGADGTPLQYMEQPPLKVGEGNGKNIKPTRLFEIAYGVLGGQVPRPFDAESLLGRSSELFIVKNGEVTVAAGFLPVPPGVVPPTAPAGYERAYIKAARKLAAQQAQQVTQPATVGQPAQAQTQPAGQPAQAQKEVAF